MEKHPFERLKSAEFVKCLGGFFKRNLISIPLIKKYPHQSITQRCNLKAATLELDTAIYPNIEYIAGTRLSVYPPNPHDHVACIMKHLIDDVGPAATNLTSPTASPPPAQPATTKQQSTSKQSSTIKQPTSATSAAAGGASSSGSQPKQQQQQKQSTSNTLFNPSNVNRQLDEHWSSFIKLCGQDSLRLALHYLYDITTAPTRELIQIMAENCSNKEHRSRMLAISSSDEAWENWVCQTQRTIKSTFEEFHSCSMAAKVLLSELNLQQPRQYSISSIKSTKRFRAEIVVFQHKFTPMNIYNNIQNVKESEQLQAAVSPGGLLKAVAAKQLVSVMARQKQQLAEASRTATTSSGKSGIRSIRSMAPFSASPISTHQVSRVPSYSGPLMNMYATSALSSIGSNLDAPTAATAPLATKSTISGASIGPGGPPIAAAGRKSKSQRSHSASSQRSTGGGGGPNQQQHKKQRSSSSTREQQPLKSSASLLSQAGATDDENSQQQQQQHHRRHHQHKKQQQQSSSSGSSSSSKLFDGLCSNYLLGLNPNDHIVCEFVENPRFTLKGNRERPIMMIGQDVGVVAFRPFWQQRAIEHDRAQVFYTLFKDLPKKKFGDMQLVCLVGNRCKIEDLFRAEIDSNFANKILSSVLYVNRNHFASLLDQTVSKGTQIMAANNSSQLQAAQNQQQEMRIDSKELLDLGDRIYKLLIEQNGCLYTCCDPQITQAIEILTVESIARNNSSLPRERVMALLPYWKGRGKPTTDDGTGGGGKTADDNLLYTLENQFERARIVQEIYDSSI